MANKNVPNDASAKSKAEGDRWESESDTVERYDERVGRSGEQGGGITNRPVGEEMDNQASLPERGESREGAHAGHGDRKEEER
jgi:hypothetical protein